MCEQSEESSDEGDIRQFREVSVSTPRLILRTPRPEDAGAFATLANNMAIAQQMSQLPHPYSKRDADGWIASVRANADPNKVEVLITLKDGGRIVGATGICPNEDGEAELNYFLGERHWGSGLATEAAQGIIDHMFTTTDIDRIIGRCRATNRGSRRVLEKCGFQYTGAGMCNSAALNGSMPSEDFVLERSVWSSLKHWGKAC